MGQQQILFLILGMCVIGVAISAGIITLQEASMPDNRETVINELHRLSKEAQAYYRRPVDLGGGEGSFSGLTAITHGISKLAPSSASAQGDFYIKNSGRSQYAEIVGVGVRPGKDPRFPIRFCVTVWPDSDAVTILN